MSIFKGNNNFTRLSNQFIYKNYFFSDGHGEEGPEVFDFDIVEFQMYGSVDLSGSSIYPKETNLSVLDSTQGSSDSHQTFSFVADMFKDVKSNLNIADFMGEIVLENEFLRPIEARRAYQSPKKLYKTYLANIMISFNDSLEANLSSLNNITHFDQYVKEFMVFLKTFYSNNPITFSMWTQSNLNSLFSTGLAISIADLSFHDDDEKYEKFMNSINFDYFKKVCRNRGFRVHKHIPFILVADVTSPVMPKYIGGTSLDELIEENYNKCYNIEYNILRNYITEYYNLFIERNPFYTKLESCRNKVTKTTVYRKPVNTEDFPHAYEDFFWMMFYLDTRNIELGSIKPESEMKRTKKYLKNFKNSLDKSEILGYIDSMFRLETFNKSFGYYHMIQRRKEAKRQRDQQEGITGGSTVTGGTSGGY